MALLEDIAAVIDSNSVTFTLGTNLFIGRLPDDPDLCCAIYQYGGEEPLKTMGGDAMPPIEEPRIQVIIRATGYATAQSTITTIWGYLEAILNENLTGDRYLRVSAVQSPFPLERDSQDRILFAQNFRVQKET